ncbi:ribosomal protein S2, partial [Vibrio cholerae HC-17A1]
NLLTVLLTS